MSRGILLAHDLTERSGPVAAAAGSLAARLRLPLTALHAVKAEDLEKRRLAAPADSAFADVILEELREELHGMVDRSLTDGTPEQVIVHTLVGEPQRAILSFLEEHNFEFTFIGIRNRSRVGKLLFGSVPQSILMGSRSKVVAVPMTA